MRDMITLLNELTSADQVIKSAAIDISKKLSRIDRNELVLEYKKRGGKLSDLHHILTGEKPKPIIIKPKENNDIVRPWAKDKISISNLSNDLYVNTPSIGVVVGTFAAVPYVHLQLESRKRFFPDIPMLVHDDHSDKTKELRGLCDKYNVDFETNSIRQPHCIGDLTAFVGGLLWAREKKLDILLKISRRWLFRTDWTIGLRELAMSSQYPTFCNFTTTFDFGFRTECVALSVSTWSQPKYLSRINKPIQESKSIFVEGFLHEIAKEIEREICSAARNYRQSHLVSHDRTGYAVWDIMNSDRMQKSDDYLWHDSNTPEEYFEQSGKWSLPYMINHFKDPNEGQGTGAGA